MRWTAFILAIWLTAGLNSQSAAQNRVALVIGNAKYQNVPSLANPANDADAISALLKSAGFQSVEKVENLGVGGMRRAIRDFSDRTRDAEIAVIYYAGHGIEAGGVNYLVPVDAMLRRDLDVEDETVPLDRLLQVMEPAKRLRLVILDACRDNPFVKSMARTMASRAIGRGLARVEPTSSDTLIAFAAKAGMTAADGSQVHSPFTAALLKHLVIPELDVRLALGRVRDDVLKTTSGKQEPFVYGSLGGSIVTLASLSKDERMESAPSITDSDSLAARDYEATARVGTVDAWDAFLAKHPKGLYSDLARSQKAKLGVPAAKPSTTVKDVPDQKPRKKEKQNNTKSASGGTEVECCLAWYRRHYPGQTNIINACAARVATNTTPGFSYCSLKRGP